MNTPFANLLKPITLNKTVIKNRIVATPVGDMIEAARGGAGIVISHTLPLNMRNSMWSNEPYPFSKYKVEETRNELFQVHAYGAKCSIELLHCGAVIRTSQGEYPLGPCEMVNDYGCTVKAMDENDMQNVINAYASMAKEAKELGYDIIFMHFAHGWLPAQFISPLYNHRTDEYGGSIENRAKFPLRILEGVRKAVGLDFPIDMRISSVEYVDGSINFEDTLAFIKMAEKYIDSVQISCGLDMGFHYEGNVTMSTTIFEPHYINVGYAERVNKEVSIPVYAVGGISDPKEADELIGSGKVDMVAVGRQFVADFDYANKIVENNPEDIAPCIRCLQCYHISTEHRNMGCSVNPRYRREKWLPAPENIAKNTTPKNVVVVGGGPAGIMAAITADKKGNNVVLIEKSDAVGGMLKYIAKEHYKEDIVRYLGYLRTQLAKSNVKVLYNTTATYDMVKAMNPEYLIVGIGAEEIKLKVPGWDQDFVHYELDAIENADKLGKRVVVVGGGTIGAEMALGLSEVDGKEVYCIEMTDKIAAKGNKLYQISMNQHIRKTENLHVMTNTKCVSIGNHTVTVEKDGVTQVIDCDDVVLAIGVKSKRDEANSFFGITPKTTLIGDCSSVRIIMDAVFEGYAAGLNTK